MECYWIPLKTHTVIEGRLCEEGQMEEE
jgi:hypothetical protein